MPRLRLPRRLAETMLVTVTLMSSAAPVALAGSVGTGAASPAAAPTGRRIRVQCVAHNHKNDQMAISLARAIDASLRGRVSTVGLYATDGRFGMICRWHAAWRFYAASVVKVTILSALLLKLQDEHRQMTAAQRNLAWLMITQSDNSAANALWYEVGYYYMQRFLDRAGMSQTRLSPYWGLTQITAHDENLLLTLLSSREPLLNRASRVYVRYLMRHVIYWQRWGVAAGAPKSVVAHIKNGWLPYPPPNYPWEINSLGIFTSGPQVYRISMLTFENPSMAYGIDTIQRAAEVIQRGWNPGDQARVAAGVPNPTWGTPDETIPGSRYRRPARH